MRAKLEHSPLTILERIIAAIFTIALAAALLNWIVLERSLAGLSPKQVAAIATLLGLPILVYWRGRLSDR